MMVYKNQKVTITGLIVNQGRWSSIKPGHDLPPAANPSPVAENKFAETALRLID